MIGPASYALGAAELVAVGVSLAFTAYRLRRRLLPAWSGAPGRLVESTLVVALLIWLGELLGTFGLLYGWSLVASSVLLAVLAVLLPLGGADLGDDSERAAQAASSAQSGIESATRPAARGGDGVGASGSADPDAASQSASTPTGPGPWSWLLTIAVIGLVVAHWGLTAKDALDRGIFNFDSLWYHMPFAVDMAQSHSTTGLHHPETVFTNWFYPQNSELLHAIGILLTQRDTLSLFLNFGFLGLAFLAAWCIGRPYGRGHLTVVAAAIVLECHTLVVREPGAAKNDLVAAALLLAAAAILVTAWSRRRGALQAAGGAVGSAGPENASATAGAGGPLAARGLADLRWPVAAAGLATGLAVGTKSTAVAMAAATTLAVIVLAPRGGRWAAIGWWLVPALLGGGYWYLRNLIVAANPLPQATAIGPIALPHPERLQHGRPNFDIAHYATDTGVWREYFEPGLHQAFGALWPLVIAAAVLGGLLALLRGRDTVLRWVGGVALFGLLAYVFTPLSAAGADGAPVGFAINIRYAIPPLLLGITLLPLSLPTADGPESDAGVGTSARRRLVRAGEWGLIAALLAVLVVTNRSDAALRDPSRPFAIALALLVVGLPALLIWWAHRAGSARRTLPGVVGGATVEDASATSGDDRSHAAAGLARRPAWSLAAVGFVGLILVLGYPLQRHYLRARFAAGSEIPGLHMDGVYGWARDKRDVRIGLAGTTAGFLQYGLYGTDLSNRVIYLGEDGPHGAYNAIPTCAAFRAAVNAADLDYLVTAPFLNFLHTSHPIPSPEAGWLRGDPAATPIRRSGPVVIWRIDGRLDSATCGPANAPLRRVPNTPQS